MIGPVVKDHNMIQIIRHESRDQSVVVLAENVEPDQMLDSIQLPNRMRFSLDPALDTTEKARKWIKTFPDARIFHVIDHNPVLTDIYRTALDEKRLTLTEVIEAQRVKTPDGEWYIDDYGFYVYAVPVLSLTGEDIGVNLITE
jgi:hypothetical protein